MKLDPSEERASKPLPLPPTPILQDNSIYKVDGTFSNPVVTKRSERVHLIQHQRKCRSFSTTSP